MKRERSKLKATEVSSYRTEVEVDKLFNQSKIVQKRIQSETHRSSKCVIFT